MKMFIVVFMLLSSISISAKDFIGLHIGGMDPLGSSQYKDFETGFGAGISSFNQLNDFFKISTKLIFTTPPLSELYQTGKDDYVDVYLLKISNLTINTEPRFAGFYWQYGFNILYFDRKGKETERGEVIENSGLNLGIQGGLGYLINLYSITKYDVLFGFDLDYNLQFIGERDEQPILSGLSIIISLYFPLFSPEK